MEGGRGIGREGCASRGKERQCHGSEGGIARPSAGREGGREERMQSSPRKR